MKKTLRLTENDLHRIVKNTVRRIISENLEQFSDNDFAGSDPYGFGNVEEEDLDYSLNGSWYFNTMSVVINGDGTDMPEIVIDTKDGDSVTVNGEDAQQILDRINNDVPEFGQRDSMYRNFYQYLRNNGIW